MKLMEKQVHFTALVVLLTSTLSFAASAEVGNWEYPELLVTPRASERLASEAKEEAENKWSMIPFYASGLATLAAGIIQAPNRDFNRDPTGITSGLAMGAGFLTLAGSIALSRFYTPYQNGTAKLSTLSKNGKREQLNYERAAEEIIDDAGRLGKRITWISVILNFVPNFYIISQSGPNSSAVGVAAAGAILSFAPLVFPMRWQKVAYLQKDYKKKIYGPVSLQPSMLVEPSMNAQNASLVPGISLALRF